MPRVVALRVDAVAAGVEDFYQSFQLKPERAAEIREGVLAELETERDQAAHDHARATHRLASLTHERKAVLQAHYTGAIPLDLLKEEMERLTREMAQAQRLTRNASKTVDELDLTLHQALTVASTCREQYLAAPPHIRRQINQGFFTRLLIAPDGSVERAELTEPFATLLADTSHEAVGCAQDAPDASGAATASEASTPVPRHVSGAQGAAGHRPTNVLVRTFSEDQKPSGDLVTAGVKEASLVHLGRSLSHPSPEVRRLLSMVE